MQPELFRAENWSLRLKNTYTVQPVPNNPSRYIPLATINVVVNAFTFLIGASSSKAPSHWYLAASVTPRYSFSLDGSNILSAIQVEEQYKIALNRLTLIQFKKQPYTEFYLEIKIPDWHEELSLEIWQYNKEFVPTTLDEKLENLSQLTIENRENIALIQQQLDRIEQDINTTTGQ